MLKMLQNHEPLKKVRYHLQKGLALIWDLQVNHWYKLKRVKVPELSPGEFHPALMCDLLEDWLAIENHSLMSITSRNECINYYSSFHRYLNSSLYIKPSCQTLSKVFDKSQKKPRHLMMDLHLMLCSYLEILCVID